MIPERRYPQCAAACTRRSDASAAMHGADVRVHSACGDAGMTDCRAASSRGELLLELLSEEIPARMQRRAIADLTALVRDKLAAAEIPAADAARLCDAAPPDRDRRGHPRAPARPHARSGAGRGSARRSRRSTAFCAPPGSPRSSNARSATPAAANSISRSSSARAARRRRCCRSCCMPRSSSCPGRNRCASRPPRCAGFGRWSRSICLFRRRGPAAAARPRAGRPDDARPPLSVARARSRSITPPNISQKLEAAHVVLDPDRAAT